MADKKELIEQLADKYHVSKSEVEKAVNSQFKFAKEKMGEDDFPTIRLPYFGKFTPNKRQIKKINENK